MARGTIPSILDDEEIKKLAKQLEGRKPMKGSRQRFTSRGEGNAAVDLRKAIGRRKDKSFEPGGLLWRVAPGWAPGAHEKAIAKVDKEWKTIGTGNPEGIPRKVNTKGSKRKNVRLRQEEQAALAAAAEKLKGLETGRPSQIPRLSREWDQKEWLNSAEYKSLGIPMEGSRERINRKLARHGGPAAIKASRELALDNKNTVSQETAPKLPETGWSNVFTKGKDGNMVGVMTRNQRLAWEKANFKQQQNLIEPGKLGQLGTTTTPKATTKLTETNIQEKLFDEKLGKKIYSLDPKNREQFNKLWDTDTMKDLTKGLGKTKVKPNSLSTNLKDAASAVGIPTNPWLLAAKVVTALATDTSYRTPGFKPNQTGRAGIGGGDVDDENLRLFMNSVA